MSNISVIATETVKRYGDALSHGDFRTLWTANIFAGAAAWALIVARGWLVFDMSDPATASLWVGLVTFAAMIPRVLVTPLTGYLSDRFDRKAVLRVMFVINLVNNLVLALLVSTGNIEIWHLVVLSLVNGSARATQMPAAQALIPNLVPRRTLLNAIALNQATMQGSRLLGPAAILPLMLTTGTEGAFFLCAAFYAISLVQSLRLRTESTGKVDRQRGLASNLAEGFVYCYKTPHLRVIIFIALLHCGLTMSYESLLPILSQQRLGTGGAGVTTLMMAVGAGAMLSSIVLAGVRTEQTRGRTFFYMGILSGVAPGLMAISTTVPLALLGAALLGASTAGFMTLTHTMIQSTIPDGVRGRIAGVYSIHVGGTMALANLTNGALADFTGAPLIFIVGGVLFIIVMTVSLKSFSLRSIYTTGLNPQLQGAAD
ncbi:MAG: hypothetical protein BZY79_00995 [SAR202 cluster bacterium Casp-Chloro-G4]|nr:MFS transporter [Chloroflexota bacterium]MDA1228638.1 MFS transporter [Chloroflexota bacterium]PKB61995.1 MAG: hypothetical protein BZY79_00995 [SAR202 cluster bacterium Casp-Chloro-G4]